MTELRWKRRRAFFAASKTVGRSEDEAVEEGLFGPLEEEVPVKGFTGFT